MYTPWRFYVVGNLRYPSPIFFGTRMSYRHTMRCSLHVFPFRINIERVEIKNNAFVRQWEYALGKLHAK